MSDDRATRLMRRLDQRGDFSLRMEMRSAVARQWNEGFTRMIEYQTVARPWWRAGLTRSTGRGFGWDLLMGSYTEEGWNLLDVLVELERRTRPRWQSLDDRVDEHRWFKELCRA